VTYSIPLRAWNLGLGALKISIKAAHQSALSHSAVGTIDKLLGRLGHQHSLSESIVLEVRALLNGPMDIVDKVTLAKGVVESFSRHQEAIPAVVYYLMENFVRYDVSAMDPVFALDALKITFAIESVLSGWMESNDDNVGLQDWETGSGPALKNWIRQAVSIFSERFREDFMIIEVILACLK
jgi:hypothetical protein